MQLRGMKLCLRYMACAFILLWGSVVQAHDGPHGPDMLAEVISAKVVGNAVLIDVLVINLGGPLVLTGMTAQGAVPIRLEPVHFNFAQEAAVSGTLQFGKAPPSDFTLILEFGVVGHGAVTVAPDAPSAPVSR